MDEYYPPEEDREHPASISGVHLMERPSRRTSGAPEGMDPRLGDRSLQPIEDLPTIPGVPILSNDVYSPNDPGASGSRFGSFGEQGQRLFGAGWEQAQHSARGLLRILEKRPGGVRKRVWLAGLLIIVLLVAL